ncbi:uncharacterized [Tachysurus ichikawai]
MTDTSLHQWGTGTIQTVTNQKQQKAGLPSLFQCSPHLWLDNLLVTSPIPEKGQALLTQVLVCVHPKPRGVNEA